MSEMKWQTMRETRKTFTYRQQPTDNVTCSLIGEACRTAAMDPKCGDSIDRGLILLRELEARGFGVVVLPRTETAQKREPS